MTRNRKHTADIRAMRIVASLAISRFRPVFLDGANSDNARGASVMRPASYVSEMSCRVSGGI